MECVTSCSGPISRVVGPTCAPSFAQTFAKHRLQDEKRKLRDLSFIHAVNLKKLSLLNRSVRDRCTLFSYKLCNKYGKIGFPASPENLIVIRHMRALKKTTLFAYARYFLLHHGKQEVKVIC